MLTGEITEGAARRTVDHQRIQIGRVQQCQHLGTVRPGLERKNPEARQARVSDSRMQIIMETCRLLTVEKRGDGLLQLLRPHGFVAVAEIAIAAAKHPVHVAVQVPFIGAH